MDASLTSITESIQELLLAQDDHTITAASIGSKIFTGGLRPSLFGFEKLGPLLDHLQDRGVLLHYSAGPGKPHKLVSLNVASLDRSLGASLAHMKISSTDRPTEVVFCFDTTVRACRRPPPLATLPCPSVPVLKCRFRSRPCCKTRSVSCVLL